MDEALQALHRQDRIIAQDCAHMLPNNVLGLSLHLALYRPHKFICLLYVTL